MASVKNLKSKGRAASGTPGSWLAGVALPYDASLYALRRAAFAALPVAKIVAPVRRCRRAFEQALAHWDRSIRVGAPDIRYPHGEAAHWAKARALNGAPSVQALAAAT